MSDSLPSPGLYIAYQASPSMGFSRQEYWSGFFLELISLDLSDFENSSQFCRLMFLVNFGNFLF